MKSTENATMTTANQEFSSSQNQKTTSLSPDSSRKRRQAAPTMWRVLSKAKKAFNAQLDKNNKMKLRCIGAYLPSETNDIAKFWSAFMGQVEKLLDSRKYLADCKRLGFNPTNIAEHVVFLGSSTINKVLREGVQLALGNDLLLYDERLSPKEPAGIFRDRVTESLKPPKSSKAISPTKPSKSPKAA